MTVYVQLTPREAESVAASLKRGVDVTLDAPFEQVVLVITRDDPQEMS